MKTKKFLASIMLAIPLLAAVTARAVENAPAGQAYTISSTAPATAVNPVKYQWYRNGNPISGATGLSYTVPAAYAYGNNVMFRRMAKTLECAGTSEAFSNSVIITFEGYVTPNGCTLVINGLCWAAANIDAPFTFATRPDMNTRFYQWNRCTTPYSTDDPLAPAWNTTWDVSETWTCNPCPAGWRMPTQLEYQLLTNTGSTWVAANVRGNEVPGRFYGYASTSCMLPSNMNGCIFIPASGFRNSVDGALNSRGTNGYNWINTQMNANSGYDLNFNSSFSSFTDNNGKAHGFPIRCVQ